ncbi:MAG: hypothetical protein KKB50_05635 [Planctomycetes bacterium]|nr:hypothetical protein [Planctomycetota bacterium]
MDVIPSSSPDTLPVWMQYFAFWASLALTVFVLIRTLLYLSRRPTLDVVVTREVLYAVMEAGESLYTNIVLIAYYRGGLIQDIQADLVKQDGATKKFALRVAHVGEKYRKPDGLYQYSFHSPSPLEFVPEERPQRRTYLFEQESYAERTREAFSTFRTLVIEARLKLTQGVIDMADQEEMSRLGSELKSLVESTCTQVMETVQVEPGEYELTVKVRYRQKGMNTSLSRSKTTTSSVRFRVGEEVRSQLRYALRAYLEVLVKAIVDDQPAPTSFPSYTPERIEELQPKKKIGFLRQKWRTFRKRNEDQTLAGRA